MTIRASHWALILLAALVAIAAIAGVAARADRRAAIRIAEAAIEAVLADARRLDELGAPGGLLDSDARLGDVDLYERSWTMWFDIEQAGFLVVSVAAGRGVSFVPMFNRPDDLRVVSIEYVEAHSDN